MIRRPPGTQRAMHPATSVADRARPPGAGARLVRGIASGRRWRLLLVAGFLVQVLWRLWLVRGNRAPVAHADEDGYLLVARVLSGGPRAVMPGWSIERPPGYPLLIMPVYWFAHDAGTVYHGALLVNAPLGAAVFPLGYLFGVRVLGMRPVWSAAASFAAALLPNVVYYGEFALTDAVLPALVLGWLLLAHAWLSTGAGRAKTLSAAGMGAVAGYFYTTHDRGVLLLGLTALLAGVAVLAKWAPGRTAGVAFGVMAVVASLGWLLNQWLLDTMFPAGHAQVGGRIIERLTSLSGLVRVMSDGTGQVWYDAVSTWGFGAVGIIAAVVLVVRRGTPWPARAVLAASFLLTWGVAIASATGIPDEGRPSNHVYGRYIAFMAPVWFIVGVSALLRSGRRRAAWLIGGGAAFIAVSGFIVLAYAAEKMAHETFVPFDSPEISFLTGDWQHLRLVTSSIVAIGVLAAVGLILAWPRRISPIAAVAALIVFNGVAMGVITNNLTNVMVRQQYASLATFTGEGGARPGDVVWFTDDTAWWTWMRGEEEIWWGEVSFLRGGPNAQPPPDVTVVVTPVSRGDGAPVWAGGPGWRRVAVEQDWWGAGWVLWRRD